MRQFARRESQELFQQRKDITAHVQASLGSMLDKPFAKVERSNWTKVVSVGGDNEKGEKAQAFERETLSKFSQRGLFGYTFERLRYWNKYDPNCFVVAEFAPFDNRSSKAQPYPFEVTADMAVDFRYSNTDLEYLAVRQEQEKADKDGNKKKVERLTLYRPVQTVVLQQLTDEEIKRLPSKPTVSKMGFPPTVQNGDLVAVDSTKVYEAVIPIPHNCPVTPAVRTGYVDSADDDGATKLSVFDSAMPFAKKLLKINSELDLVMALLAFPVSIRHEETCGETGCSHGKLPDGATCSACHGSGYKPRPTSAQEEILLPMPDRAEDMLDVSKILSYTYPPTEAVRLQMEVWREWFDRGFRAVFNSEMYSKPEQAQTAMFHGVQLQSIYDTLYPYGRHISQVCAYLARVIGHFTKTADAIAMPVIPTDLRFETVGDLFAELKSLRDAGGSSDAATIIEARIMGRLLRDDQEALKRWETENWFNPFAGMTEEQVLSAMQSGLVPERKKVFYANRQDIFAEIAAETPTFYKLARSEQKRLVDVKLDALLADIRGAQPRLNLGNIGGKAVSLEENPPFPAGN